MHKNRVPTFDETKDANKMQWKIVVRTILQSRQQKLPCEIESLNKEGPNLRRGPRQTCKLLTPFRPFSSHRYLT